jgi:hypothetical protein
MKLLNFVLRKVRGISKNLMRVHDHTLYNEHVVKPRSLPFLLIV